MNDYHVAHLPVVEDDNYLGIISEEQLLQSDEASQLEERQLLGIVTYNDLLRNASDFMSLHLPGALIVLEVESHNYSFTQINRIVESNDAQITQLNTLTDPETGTTQVTIRVNKVEVSDLVSTFQRYEYNVKHYFGEELYQNELKTNYDNLMNYLNV
jgi:CBS domain-containing protein